MAILIPSKNIYSMSNPKIIDNVINRVTVEQTVVSPNNEYEIPVYNQKQSLGEGVVIQSPYTKIEGGLAMSDTTGTRYNDAISYLSVIIKYVNLNIMIPVVSENKYIKEFLLGRDDNNVPQIKYSVSAKKTTNNVTATATRASLIEHDVSITNITTNFVKEESIVIQPQETILEFENPVTTGGALAQATANATITYDSFNTKTTSWANINNYGIVTENGKEYYKFPSISFLLCSDVTKIGAKGLYNTQISDSGQYTGSGTQEVYTPESIEITFYGNTIGINLTEGAVAYGDGNMPYSLNGNELLQDSATVNGVPLTKYLADNVLQQYENGKETATILCDISDYYEYAPTAQNLKGNKIISVGKIASSESYPMTFKIQDQVVPMTFGANGKDKPMSLKKDGTPKVFSVVGVEMIYDGAVWQKLSLQEV